MINPSTIHLIKSGMTFLLFHYPSYSLISLDPSMGKLIEDFKKGVSVDEMSLNHNVSVEDINNTLSKLETIFEKNASQIKREERRHEDTVDRITLHISNDCNLRCKYCYANGGDYHQRRHMMTVKTAEEFVSFCAKNFDDIRKIVFFGGEPCLNINIMEFVCKRFNLYYAEGKIKNIPKFVIITNGTLINNRLLELIKKYISYITVSIDGNEYLNDHNRKDKNGNGTFTKIAKFIDTIKNETNVLIQYEATYTDFHISEHVSKNDIATYMKERFGINGFVVNEISVNTVINEEILSVENPNNLPECFTDILQAISLKKPLNFCSVSLKQFAVSASGLIFPCHMDVGHMNLNLGHIAQRNIFNDSSYCEKIKIRNHIGDKSVLCPDCWAQNLCEGCPRYLFYDEDKGIYMEQPNQNKCERQKKYIEKILALIAELRTDRNKWNKYVKAINNL